MKKYEDCPVYAFRKALGITINQAKNNFNFDSINWIDERLYKIKNKSKKLHYIDEGTIKKWIEKQKFERLKSELVFAKDPKYAFHYARYVLKSRFPEKLENKMFQSDDVEDPKWLFNYFSYFFSKEERLPETLHNRMVLATFNKKK